ncbi:MAG: hypothetical protein Q9217_006698 [Psora testacea]
MDMDNMFGAGGANNGQGGGAIGQFPLEQWFYEMPICTRYWTTATIATSILVQCHIITPFQLFYSFRAVFVKNQAESRNPVVVSGAAGFHRAISALGVDGLFAGVARNGAQG